MFEDLRNSISLMFSGQWPTTEACISRVCLDPTGQGLLRVTYEFSLGT